LKPWRSLISIGTQKGKGQFTFLKKKTVRYDFIYFKTSNIRDIVN
jgi:hypothetical protein